MRFLFLVCCLMVSALGSEPVELKTPEGIVELEGTLPHVQGIDIEGQSLWVTSVDRATKRGFLHLFNARTGKLIRQVEVQDGERYHPGGLSRDKDAIWLPVAEYRRASTSVIQKRNKKTLELISSFAVADHIGCVAAQNGHLIGGTWDSRDFYEWDQQGREISKRPNPSHTSYQDLKFQGAYLIGSGPTGPSAGLVEWVDRRSLDVVRRLALGKTDRGVRYTNEGMAIRGKHIYFLPEDGRSRLFSFRLP